MAAAEDAGPLPGPAAGPHLEPLGPGRGQRAEITRDPPATKDAGSSYQATTSSRRVRMWWCSARSVAIIYLHRMLSHRILPFPPNGYDPVTGPLGKPLPGGPLLAFHRAHAPHTEPSPTTPRRTPGESRKCEWVLQTHRRGIPYV